MEQTIKSVFKYRGTQVILVLYFVFLAWRIGLLFFIPASNAAAWSGHWISFWWGGLYNAIALVGGILGLFIAKKWGGIRSTIGQCFTALSIGLLLQSFGQIAATYYVWYKISLYPSVADIGFFGSVIFYIIGVLLLAKASSVGSALKSISHKAYAVIFPLLMLTGSYMIFLRGYTPDYTQPLKIFLDFGYPLGQAFYVSIAIFVLIVSRKMWGESMKKPMILLLIALIVQYSSDFLFLYQSNNNTYIAGGIVDFMYMTAYFLMAFSLVYLGSVFYKIKSESQVATTAPVGSSNKGDLLTQILTEIIKRQVRVAGQLAWQEVHKVPGITVTDEQNVVVSMTGDPKKTIDQLLVNYKSLFGKLAVEVSKNAVYYLTAELPADQIPNSLK